MSVRSGAGVRLAAAEALSRSPVRTAVEGEDARACESPPADATARALHVRVSGCQPETLPVGDDRETRGDALVVPDARAP